MLKKKRHSSQSGNTNSDLKAKKERKSQQTMSFGGSVVTKPRESQKQGSQDSIVESAESFLTFEELLDKKRAQNTKIR